MNEWKTSYRANRIKQTLINKCFFNAILLALPPSSITSTNRRPRPIYTGTTTAKQQIVIQLVLASRRSPSTKHPRRRPLDRNDNSTIIRSRKNLSPEPICIRLPSKRVRLEKKTPSAISKIHENKTAHTLFHPVPRSYHAGSDGSTYALFVILANSRSVSRLSTFGPKMSSSSQSSHSLSP